MTTTPKLNCPDDGTCHHGCTTKCFRVEGCAPLSGVFPGDVWPLHVKYSPKPGPASIAPAERLFIDLARAFVLAGATTMGDNHDVGCGPNNGGAGVSDGRRRNVRVTISKYALHIDWNDAAGPCSTSGSITRYSDPGERAHERATVSWSTCGHVSPAEALAFATSVNQAARACEAIDQSLAWLRDLSEDDARDAWWQVASMFAGRDFRATVNVVAMMLAAEKG